MDQKSVKKSGPGDRIVYQLEESQLGTAYQAFCPELVIVGFGDNPEEARSALRTQVSYYLEDCDAMGILEEVLIDAGFYDDGTAWISNEVSPVREPKVVLVDSIEGLADMFKSDG